MNNEIEDNLEGIKDFSKVKWPLLKTLGNSFLATMSLGMRHKQTTFPEVFSNVNAVRTKKLIDKFFINYNKNYHIKDLKISHKNFDWINFKKDSIGNKYVYVLLLHHSRLYIGYSKNIIERLNSHIDTHYFSYDFLEKNNSQSSEWVKKWKLEYILKVYENADEEFENELTLYLIEHYGWKWVRGGKYVQFHMENPLK